MDSSGEIDKDTLVESTDLSPTIENKLPAAIVSRILNDVHQKHVPITQQNPIFTARKTLISDGTACTTPKNQSSNSNQSQLQSSRHRMMLNNSEAIICTGNNGQLRIPGIPVAKQSDSLKTTENRKIPLLMATASGKKETPLTKQNTQACVNMNNLRTQQASQSNFTLTKLGMYVLSNSSLNIKSVNMNNFKNHQSSPSNVGESRTSLAQLKFPTATYHVKKLSVAQVPKDTVLPSCSSSNNEKNDENSRTDDGNKITISFNLNLNRNAAIVPPTMSFHPSSEFTVSKPNVMNNMNKIYMNNSSIPNNQVEHNKTSSINTSNRGGPEEVTEQKFTVRFHPVHNMELQKIQGFHPPSESENVEVKVEESLGPILNLDLQPDQNFDPPPELENVEIKMEEHPSAVPNLDLQTDQNSDPPLELEVQVKTEESPDPVVVSGHRTSARVREKQRVKEKPVVESVSTQGPQKKQKRKLKKRMNKRRGVHYQTSRNRSNIEKMMEMDFKFFKCGICDEGFRNLIGLQTHVLQHKGIQRETIKCGYCGMNFLCKSGGLVHLRCVHGIVCDKPKAGMEEVNLPTYESDGNSVQTLRVIRTKIPKCEACERIFSNLEILAQHKQKSNCAYVWYRCVSCGKQVGKETREEVPLPEELLCNQCHKSGNKPKENAATVMEQEKQGSERVVDAEHAGLGNKKSITYDCLACGRSYKQKSSYDRHLKLSHGTVKAFKCDLCNKAYVCSSSLREHKLSHTETESFACDKCTKTFKRRNLLKKHMQRHEPAKFPCNICGKILRSKGLLRDHKRLHTGEKPFLCEICGRRFTRRMSKNFHMQTHDSSSRSQCEICGKLFTFKHSLRHHLMMHKVRGNLSLKARSSIADMPHKFICEICGKGFYERSVYRGHKLMHHYKTNPDARPKCDICNKSFSSKSNLRAHIEIHRGLTWVKCGKCNKVMHKQSMKKHTC
ncbi:zinc finger protein 761-like [Saccostrea cucullata]|uniref:zinc finger protein 761-like n=1 Tax=Saccostrea cuccullata TaxID=36930 RepID=UPI002ED4F100